MDVCLVLTHRCNLACTYCYAGDHHRAAMDEATLGRAVDLLWADGADTAQLSFFGGEPFLRFDAMKRAVELAQASATARGKRLLLQCTTNGTLIDEVKAAWVKRVGMRVVVSCDGVKEAHDLARPRPGGSSSFGDVYRGLKHLTCAGCRPDVLMVITPATALFVFRSVRFFWNEGVETVRANLDVRATWTPRDRDDLGDELEAVGREVLHRRLTGRRVSFEPFDAAMVGAAAPACGAAPKAQRGRVTVATGGNLYACAPMVGEDRDDGAEAALRLGQLGDGPEAVCAAVAAKGTGCGAGKGCACAAYLETGDASTPGEQQRWFGRLCRDVAVALAAGLAQAEARRAAGDDIAAPPAREPNKRRKALVGLALGAGGLAVAGVGLVSISRLGTQSAGALPATPEPHTAPAPSPPPPFDPELMPPGQMALPEPPPEPPPNVPAGGIGPPPLPPEPPPPAVIEGKTDGEMIMEGDIGAP